MQCDKHVVKMVLETAQMLSTAARKRGFELGYKSAYPKHPMTKWISESPNNYSWAIQHGLALGTEYQLRYHRVHKSHEVIKELAMLDSGDATQMTNHHNVCPMNTKPMTTYNLIVTIMQATRNVLHGTRTEQHQSLCNEIQIQSR